MERLMIFLVALILTVFTIGLVSTGEIVFKYFVKRVGEDVSQFNTFKSLIEVVIMAIVIVVVVLSFMYLLR